MKLDPNDTSRLLDAVAADFIATDVNLLPQIAARFERKPFTQTLRARPALIILLALLAFSLLTGVAYAVGHSLGYIPGIGLVEQGGRFRVLAEPVSLTRDGITLTIEEAFLSSEKTLVRFNVKGIPQSARPKGETGSMCVPSMPSLRLSNGTVLEAIQGEGSGDALEMTMAPVPEGVSSVTFFLPCLFDVAPGKAPENWEIVLRFKPAPPDLTVVPVIEVATPLSTTPALKAAKTLASDPFLDITLNIDSFTRTERGYILITSLRGNEKIWEGISTNQHKSISLVDATGKKIELLPLEFANIAGNVAPNHTALGFSVADDTFTAPLTLTMDWLGIIPVEKPQFIFDPGTHPQVGQTWPINQQFDVLGFPLQIESARFVPNVELNQQEWMHFRPKDMIGFEFTIAENPAIQVLQLGVRSGFSADGSGMSGFLTPQATGKLKPIALLNGQITAPLAIEATYLEVRHPWQITFNPADITTNADTPANAGVELSLQIEKVIPLDDGYYLLGRTYWHDPRFTGLGLLAEWDAKLRDPNGGEIPLEPINYVEMGLGEFDTNRWAFRVYGKVLPTNLTLSMHQAWAGFNQPYTFTFDAGPNPQIGQEWQINQTLDILGYKVTVEKAVFVQRMDLRGFEFSLTADPELENLSLNIESGVTDQHGHGDGLGVTTRDENGLMKVDTITDGQYAGPILIAIRNAVLNGNWQVKWNPPAAEPGATPFILPQACVTPEKWQQATIGPNALTVGFPARVLLSRGAISPDPTMFIANFDGSNEQGLVFTTSDGSLSPDASKLVYSNEEGRLYMLEIASGKKTAVMDSGLNPKWSPDGAKIAFDHYITDKGWSIYVMDGDGKNMHAMTDPTKHHVLLDWTGDSTQLIILTHVQPNEDRGVVNTLNIETGAVHPLVTTLVPYDLSVAISPDLAWVVYVDKVIGKMEAGLYISRVDGSEKRLLLLLDDGWMPGRSLWSPDGKWISSLIGNIDSTQYNSVATLINVETCQVVRLPGINGQIDGWVK